MRALEFDFSARTDRSLPVSEAVSCRAPGKYLWFDLDAASELTAAESLLRKLGLDGPVLSAALKDCGGASSYLAHPGGLVLSLVAPDADSHGLNLARVGLVLTDGFCATVRSGDVAFLSEVWETSPDDFRQYAQSPGFLLYEIWDHLLGAYRKAANRVGDEVIAAQETSFNAGDELFNSVAGLSRNLLALRRAMVASRELLSELVTRKSSVVPDSTMPYLQALVVTFDRLVADLAVEREILAETLNLHIGIVGHRTNQVVNRLTVISFVFLPLTFLCGVYGMNFKYLPELEWKYGYHSFWVAALAIVTLSLTYMRRRGWW